MYYKYCHVIAGLHSLNKAAFIILSYVLHPLAGCTQCCAWCLPSLLKRPCMTVQKEANIICMFQCTLHARAAFAPMQCDEPACHCH